MKSKSAQNPIWKTKTMVKFSNTQLELLVWKHTFYLKNEIEKQHCCYIQVQIVSIASEQCKLFKVWIQYTRCVDVSNKIVTANIFSFTKAQLWWRWKLNGEMEFFSAWIAWVPMKLLFSAHQPPYTLNPTFGWANREEQKKKNRTFTLYHSSFVGV